MSTLTHSQEVARSSFIDAVLNGSDSGYPDHVRIVPITDLSIEHLSDLLAETMPSGVSIVFVRDDGAEMLLEPYERHGVGRLIDRALRRIRVQVYTRGEPAPHEARYVHPDRVHDLRGLRGRLALC